MLTLEQRRSFEERQLFVEHALVARDAAIVLDRISEPDDVVRDQRTHARTGSRQPPMLDVTFAKLPEAALTIWLRASDGS